MDSSVTRRGKRCWHLCPGISTPNAINDSLMLHGFVYEIIGSSPVVKHLSAQDHVKLYQIFSSTVMRTIFGQNLDTNHQTVLKVDDERLVNWERYTATIQQKTSYYSFNLSFYLGLLLTNEKDPKVYQQTEEIARRLGAYFQIQDDYLDCYGDPAVTGKVGTDIEDNKLTWLLIECVKRCTPEELKLLKEHYGRSDVSSVEVVKKLYEQKGLRNVYTDLEKTHFSELQSAIETVENPALVKLAKAILNSMYRRKK